MMKKLIWVLVVILILLLSAYILWPETEEPEPTPGPTEPTQTQTDPPTDPPTDPTIAPPTVIEQHFLPLEDNSWEREHDPEFVMIHFTSVVVLDKQDPYNMEAVKKLYKDSELSVHYVIDRDGSIYCWIPESRVAWHAGKGTFGGDERLTNKMNYYAIGIELLGIGSQFDMGPYLTGEEYASLDPSLIGFTEAQYQALESLLADICSRNNIPMDRDHIIGHEDYSDTKTDPGDLFDWDRVVP